MRSLIRFRNWLLIAATLVAAVGVGAWLGTI